MEVLTLNTPSGTSGRFTNWERTPVIWSGTMRINMATLETLVELVNLVMVAAVKKARKSEPRVADKFR